MRDTARMDHSELNETTQPEDLGPAHIEASSKLTYSVAETASLIGISRASVYRLIARRVLIPIPGLRHKRIPKKQVRRLASSDGFEDLA